MTLEPRAERTQQAIPNVMMSSETTSNKCCQLKEIILSFISLSFYGLQNYIIFQRIVLPQLFLWGYEYRTLSECVAFIANPLPLSRARDPALKGFGNDHLYRLFDLFTPKNHPIYAGK
jgi:hypothetical protein